MAGKRYLLLLTSICVSRHAPSASPPPAAAATHSTRWPDSCRQLYASRPLMECACVCVCVDHCDCFHWEAPLTLPLQGISGVVNFIGALIQLYVGYFWVFFYNQLIFVFISPRVSEMKISLSLSLTITLSLYIYTSLSFHSLSFCTCSCHSFPVSLSRTPFPTYRVSHTSTPYCTSYICVIVVPVCCF